MNLKKVKKNKNQASSGMLRRAGLQPPWWRLLQSITLLLLLNADLSNSSMEEVYLLSPLWYSSKISFNSCCVSTTLILIPFSPPFGSTTPSPSSSCILIGFLATFVVLISCGAVFGVVLGGGQMQFPMKWNEMKLGENKNQEGEYRRWLVFD